jgi:hypothetical protein
LLDKLQQSLAFFSVLSNKLDPNLDNAFLKHILAKMRDASIKTGDQHKKIIGQVLQYIAEDFSENPFVQEAKNFYYKKMSESPATIYITLQVIADELSTYGKKVRENARRIELTSEGVSELSSQTRELFRDLGILKEDSIDLKRRVTINGGQLMKLSNKMREIEIGFERFQIKIIQMLINQDERFQRALDNLQNELQELRGITSELDNDIMALQEWRNSNPEQVAKKLPKVARFFSKLASFICLGPNYGFVSFNAFGALSELFRLVNL